MDNSVIIKGSKNGFSVLLDKEMAFDDLLVKVEEKFTSFSKFFKNANMAISFDGRELSKEEEKQLLDVISKVSDINIVCIIDNDGEIDSIYENAVKKALSSVEIKDNDSACKFYKGTLRSGQEFISDSSVIVLGDVNPGAKIVSKGNVIILGSLRGNIFAGVGGNQNSFVVALEMNPMQIKIGDVIARSSDTGVKISKNKTKIIEPKIAYVFDDNIYIEDIEQDVLNDIIIE